MRWRTKDLANEAWLLYRAITVAPATTDKQGNQGKLKKYSFFHAVGVLNMDMPVNLSPY